jgi:dipeptidase D
MSSLISSTPFRHFTDLLPETVWAHFATLCAIPRPSKGEARLRDHLRDWAVALGLHTSVDEVGNLIVRKPASAGYESAPGVVLQSHLDMVCQNNADTPHDFTRDPIVPVLRDGWLIAEGTTLGADNGIGVALILAVLEDDTLSHGPIEALFTVDEESGMGGARGLAADALQGRLMLNLDTEEWGQFYLGCAGGVDVNVRRPGHPEAVPAGYTSVRIDVRGLRGGHSGVNIHEGRGNAIKLLVRMLRQLEHRWDIRLSTLQGGTARNALPREASALLVLPVDALAGLGDVLAEQQAVWREELAGIDANVSVSSAPCELGRVMAATEQALWLSSLHAAPQGVRRMSIQVPGVVETSDNLGVINLNPESGECNFMVRSLVDSAAVELADEIVSLFALSHTRAEPSGHYPGWRPNPASPLLGVCQSVYRATFGGESTTEVIHAGLECGIIGGKYPGLDMVSFGPTIRGAHAPGEAVEVQSVERCWRLLRAILAALV